MRLFIVGLAALAIGAAAPCSALAKVKKAHVKPAPKAWRAPARAWGGVTPYGQRPRSAHPQWDVYRLNGEYAGTDPDPRVRGMLFRDDPNADP